MLASNVEFVCTVTNNSLKTAFNATCNGGAGHVLPYGEQKVLLEPVFCEIFRNAWSMYCIAGGDADRRFRDAACVEIVE